MCLEQKICNLCHPQTPVRLLPPSAYTQLENHTVRVPYAKSDCSRRGKAEVRILNFKTTWSEFHHLPRAGPKQLCALAHLGCTRAAGTSYLYQNNISMSQSFCPNISLINRKLQSFYNQHIFESFLFFIAHTLVLQDGFQEFFPCLKK